ncbi:acyltransferase family protein [Lentilactobacillus senioris]|uniref:acyltransferase family protein n=1 Tax=Lentilactobacillus senioris TaxID=931534 RepID=UPI0022822D30|nr:acyltransferase family protein [Lentilactobacillus senioris]MCY9807497.1 acyltransferase family protein [Lentilactobacillus senioris]
MGNENSRVDLHANAMKSKKARYITGIDGIRTLAVLGVIFYHLLPFSIPGGFAGVSIFFVISGYLITASLLNENQRNGKINFGQFSLRRIKRLYPTLVAMLIATGAYITIFAHQFLMNLRVTIGSNLVYLYNWWEISHGQNYFDRFNGESPFTHLWSLSIEGQFYIIWPLILIAMLALGAKSKHFGWLLTGLTIISVLLMAFLYNPANINRAYYGTDTRAFSITIGAWLAFYWPQTKLAENISNYDRTILDVTGIISFLILIGSFFVLNGQKAFAYRGGLLIVSLASALLLAVCVHPGSHVNRWLTNPVFSWVGQRSYGIYLYQFPVMIFYEAAVKQIAAHPLMNMFIEIALILLLSELSYRFIEQPFRKITWRQFTGWFNPNDAKRQLHLGLAGAAAIFTLICSYGMIIAPKADQAKPNHLQQNIKNNEAATEAKNKKLAKNQAATGKKLKHNNSYVVSGPVKWNKKNLRIAKEYHLTKKVLMTVQNIKMTAVGDSVLADSSKDLQTVFQQTYVSAEVGMQPEAAYDILATLKARDQLAPTVLINIGTNGPITTDQVQRYMKLVGKNRQVFWITAHVPTRSWEGQVNQTLVAASHKYSNLHLVNWHKASLNKSSWFWEDDVHPNPTGNKKFVKVVANTLYKHR